MRKYFELQYKIINRNLVEFGVQPPVAYALGVVTFIVISIALFYKTKFAVYIYPGIALTFLLKLSEGKRNNFLKNLFSLKHFYKLRVIENGLIVLPFILFLLYKNCFKTSMVLLLLTIAFAFFDIFKTFSITLPTPFYKKPFEFIAGFRKSFIVILLSYTLTIIGIRYQNFNLAISSLVLIFGTCFSFYAQPETPFYVWIFNVNANGFLFNKIKTATYFSAILCIPATILLMVFFTANFYWIIGVQIIGFVYLGAIVIAKYANYPNAINLPQGLLLTISLLFPPLLAGVIPFFYLQSAKRLKEILE